MNLTVANLTRRWLPADAAGVRASCGVLNEHTAHSLRYPHQISIHHGNSFHRQGTTTNASGYLRYCFILPHSKGINGADPFRQGR
jgi:hypothetical protein